MPSNAYSFRTDWAFQAQIDEISAILEDIPSLSTWWPSVYLDVRVLEPGDDRGIGKRVALLTKGWLPYTLRWNFTVTESNCPHGFRLAADGDFEGEGVWTLWQDGPVARVRFDWTILANKPLLRRLSFALKPLFAANHEWAMRQGRRSLEAEISRRRQNCDRTEYPGDVVESL